MRRHIVPGLVNGPFAGRATAGQFLRVPQLSKGPAIATTNFCVQCADLVIGCPYYFHIEVSRRASPDGRNPFCGDPVLASVRLRHTGAEVQTGTSPPQVSFKAQPFQRPEKCLPCHQRQYDELHSAVKSGYRNVSPLFNGLESAANLVNGGLLRPVYQDSTIVLPDGTTLNTNMYTSPILTETRQVQAGFCFTCHNANVEVIGEDPTKREVPQLAGLGTCNPAPPAGQQCFQPQLFRPLRDYVMVDANGNQILPAAPGGDPQPGALPSLGAAGITCDFCHDENGPDLNRSFQMDGFANTSLLLNQTELESGALSISGGRQE